MIKQFLTVIFLLSISANAFSVWNNIERNMFLEHQYKQKVDREVEKMLEGKYEKMLFGYSVLDNRLGYELQLKFYKDKKGLRIFKVNVTSKKQNKFKYMSTYIFYFNKKSFLILHIGLIKFKYNGDRSFHFRYYYKQGKIIHKDHYSDEVLNSDYWQDKSFAESIAETIEEKISTKKVGDIKKEIFKDILLNLYEFQLNIIDYRISKYIKGYYFRKAQAGDHVLVKYNDVDVHLKPMFNSKSIAKIHVLQKVKVLSTKLVTEKQTNEAEIWVWISFHNDNGKKIKGWILLDQCFRVEDRR